MKLTMKQFEDLMAAVNSLDEADELQQLALEDHDDLSADLHYRIDSLMDEINGLIEDAEIGDE